MNFHSCLSPVKRSKHHKQEGSMNSIKRRSKCSMKRQRRKNELDVILTYSECRWYVKMEPINYFNMGFD